MLVPKPRKLKNGEYVIRLRINGEERFIRDKNLRRCQTNAQLAKAQMLSAPRRPSKSPEMKTLGELLDTYIADRSAILSPSTIRGYKTIRNTRFAAAICTPVYAIENWQTLINTEAEKTSAKTLKNAWGLVSAALSTADIKPHIVLPKVQKTERPFLDPEQIRPFIDAIKDKPGEIDALLALHGLRRSELLALQKSDVRGGYIHVHGAIVPNSDHVLQRKETTKTLASSRFVPVLIPRLQELINASPDGQLANPCPETTFRRINRACVRANLPEVGIHGLRHTFASLCYSLGISELDTMRMGGWSDYNTMRKIYTHLAEKDMKKSEKRLASFFANRSKMAPKMSPSAQSRCPTTDM